MLRMTIAALEAGKAELLANEVTQKSAGCRHEYGQ